MTGFVVCWASFVIPQSFQVHRAVKATSIHVCLLRTSLPMGLQRAILLAVGCTGSECTGQAGMQEQGTAML